MAYEKNDSEYAIYTNAVVVEGEIMGGIFDTEFEALEDARGIVAEFEGMTNNQTEEIAVLAGLDAAALEDRIEKQDVVGFAVVAQRSVLYSEVHHERG
jgi:ribonuclease HI